MASESAITLQLQKLANQNTEKTFKFNSAEAVKSRNWQTQMSNTSHQREVKDLIAAGLNPVLSSGGSGAQSYTTSSASGTADSAVNAIGGIEQSRLSAAATRYMADQNLAAARASAAAQLAAARIAAGASNYYANVQKEIAFHGPTNSPVKVVDKLLTNLGAYGKVGEVIKNAVANNVKQLRMNPQKFFNTTKDPDIRKNNFVLNKQGYSFVNRNLDRLNLRVSPRNQELFIKAFVFEDRAAQRSISELIRLANARKVYTYNRVSNVWRSSI